MNIIAFFIYYLLSILMIIITIMCYSYLSEKIIILSKLKIIGILICCIFVFLNNIYNLVSLRYITSIILVLIVNKIVFNDNFNNLSYYTIIYSILSIIVDLTLSCFLINNIQNIDIFNNQVFFKSLFSLLESLILLFITKNKWLISLVNKIKK